MKKVLCAIIITIFGIFEIADCMKISLGSIESEQTVNKGGAVIGADRIVSQYLGSLDLNNKCDVASAINETHYRRFWRKSPVKGRCRYDEYRSRLIHVLLDKLQNNSTVVNKDAFILLLQRMDMSQSQPLAIISKNNFASLGVDDIVLSEAEIW